MQEKAERLRCARCSNTGKARSKEYIKARGDGWNYDETFIYIGRIGTPLNGDLDRIGPSKVFQCRRCQTGMYGTFDGTRFHSTELIDSEKWKYILQNIDGARTDQPHTLELNELVRPKEISYTEYLDTKKEANTNARNFVLGTLFFFFFVAFLL
jgi:hypothetical protein